MEDEIIEVDGQKWKVRFAVSRERALNEIAMARVTGSVGSRLYEQCDDGIKVLADVVRLNADGNERKPS